MKAGSFCHWILPMLFYFKWIRVHVLKMIVKYFLEDFSCVAGDLEVEGLNGWYEELKMIR